MHRCVDFLCPIRLRAKKPKPRGFPEVPETLGDRIRRRRMELGLLQREVAGFIGVDESTVWNWEANRVHPSPRYLSRILEFLVRGGVPPRGGT